MFLEEFVKFESLKSLQKNPQFWNAEIFVMMIQIIFKGAHHQNPTFWIAFEVKAGRKGPHSTPFQKINSQSLELLIEDTQAGYTSHQTTSAQYT